MVNTSLPRVSRSKSNNVIIIVVVVDDDGTAVCAVNAVDIVLHFVNDAMQLMR